MAKQKSKKPQPRLHRTLYGEPTQHVPVRLPVSIVETIDKMVTLPDSAFRDRTDFIRNAIITAVRGPFAEFKELPPGADIEALLDRFRLLLERQFGDQPREITKEIKRRIGEELLFNKIGAGKDSSQQSTQSGKVANITRQK